MNNNNNNNNNNENENVYFCADCGTEINESNDDFENCDGNRICEDCYYNNYVTCEECGDVLRTEDSVDFNNMTLCTFCGDNYSCDNCNQEYTINEYETVNGLQRICDDCYTEDYIHCADCGRLMHINDDVYVEMHGDYFCDDCSSNHENSNEDYIEGYSYKPSPIFHKTSIEIGLETLDFGTELELEGISSSFCEEFLEIVNGTYLEDLFYFKSDGSLSGESVEIVSHPFTYNFLMDNIETFKRIFNFIKENSETSSRTGLHIHTNKNYYKNEDSIDKLILFFEYYMNEIKIFSKRHSYRYCGFLQDKFVRYDTTELEKQELVTKDKINQLKYNTDRYTCINIENRNTIECRIFEATQELETFIAYIEFLKSLIELCNTKKENEFGFDTVLKSKDTMYLKNFIKTLDLTIPKGNMRNNRIKVIRTSNKNKKQVIELKKELVLLINDNLGTISKTETEKLRDYFINYSLLRLKRFIRSNFTNKEIDKNSLATLCNYIEKILYNLINNLNTGEFNKKQKTIFTELNRIKQEFDKLKGGIL